jgi:hypothetical protein
MFDPDKLHLLTDDMLEDIGLCLRDAMSNYHGSLDTPDYAVRVAKLVCKLPQGKKDDLLDS